MVSRFNFPISFQEVCHSIETVSRIETAVCCLINLSNFSLLIACLFIQRRAFHRYFWLVFKGRLNLQLNYKSQELKPFFNQISRFLMCGDIDTLVNDWFLEFWPCPDSRGVMSSQMERNSRVHVTEAFWFYREETFQWTKDSLGFSTLISLLQIN